MTDTPEVSLLGGVAVRGRGTPATSRAIGLLAYLVLHAEAPQSRSHLAGMFWPDSSEAQARTNLRRELHHLRAILGDVGCLVTTGTTLAWRDVAGFGVDVRTFLRERETALEAGRRGDVAGMVTAATAAVDAYRGPFLPGWYDDWILEARNDLQRSCIDLCDRVVSEAAPPGSVQVLALARRRVQLSPLEEQGYQQLMRLQAEGGDRAGAVTTYHTCASILEQELGVSPSPATTAAMAAIIEEGAEPASAASGAVRTQRSAVHRPRLIGRTPQVDELLACWRRARRGAAGLALVSGEAGVGKSRLVTELARRLAKEGAVVASARCFGASGRLALAPVAEWLRSSQLQASWPALESVWLAEVARLVPASAATVPASSALNAKADAWQRLRFFEGLARAVLVGGRPTLLVLDDLQWCDDETLLWLSFLLDLGSTAPLLIVATAREEELADNVGALSVLRALRPSGRVTEVALKPFTEQETGAVASQMLGIDLPETQVALLHSATAGFPLYVVEAVRNAQPDAAEGGLTPDDVGGVLRQRLSTASEPAQEVAGLAAAVGRNFGLDLLTDASDLDADSVVRAVDELWRRRILHQSGGGYDFGHDLLRETAYASVPPARRWLHHRRLAEALEARYAGQLDDVAAQVADHHARSGRPDLALPSYARAADAAMRVFASAEAVRLLRLSLELIQQLPAGVERDRAELSTLQAISAPLNARYGYADPQLEQVLNRSIELAEGLGDTRVLLASIVGLWASRFVFGEIGASYALARQALELSEQVPELAGQAHFAAGGSAITSGAPRVAVEHLDLARELSAGGVSLTVGTRPEVHAQAWAAHARWLLGDTAGAHRDAEEAIGGARRANHPYTLAVALAYAAITHQMAHDLRALDADLHELADLCERYDLAYYREWGQVLAGWRRGGSDGITEMRAGLRRLSGQHSFARMPYWLALLADVHVAEGDLEAARADLDAAQVAAIQHDDRWWLPEVLRKAAALQPPVVACQTLERALATAREQASTALVHRCERDLEALSVRRPGAPVRVGEEPGER